MNINGLISFFAAHRQRGDELVLATVIDTEGSTYSKAGAQMLIDAEGRFQGMLSGGCLEGDLAVRARAVIESGKPQVVTYDLGQDEELWGLGVGCEGVMHVLLQALDRDYEPFASVVGILQGDEPGVVALELDKRVDVRPLPRLLILGAGLDAEPVVRIAAELGWRCTVCDHRPAYISAGHFEDADSAHCQPADDIGAAADLSRYQMAVVMSHHLVSDLAYLRQLAASEIPYVGLLGPAARRDRLLRELGEDAAKLEGRLHGPAGLDIGGRGPASIALSIVAQMHAVYHGKI